MHISKSKRYFNLKSSTHYFHRKLKILADSHICVGVRLTLTEDGATINNEHRKESEISKNAKMHPILYVLRSYSKNQHF